MSVVPRRKRITKHTFFLSGSEKLYFKQDTEVSFRPLLRKKYAQKHLGIVLTTTRTVDPFCPPLPTTASSSLMPSDCLLMRRIMMRICWRITEKEQERPASSYPKWLFLSHLAVP